MRAILIATGASSRLGTLAEQFAAPMLPLVDRPFVQHVVESLVARGFTEFDLVVSHLAHRIEEHFGDGQRWGISIRYHVARDANRPYRLLRTMNPILDDEPVLLGHADRFPLLGAIDRPTPEGGPIVYCEHERLPDSERPVWTGWAWINRADSENLPTDADEEALANRLIARAGNRGLVEGQGGMSTRDFASLLASNRDALTSRPTDLLFGAREIEPGIWLSHNVVIHPTARLTPPVYLCEDCNVGEGVEVGPDTVVGAGCILDRRCSVAGSVLFPSSYVGEGLELRDVIVVRNHLVDVRLGVEVALDDDLLLASASSQALGARLGKLLSRATAVAALAITWPILLVTAVVLTIARGGRAFAATEAVRLPAPSDEARWKTYRLWRFDMSSRTLQRGESQRGLSDLVFRFLPGLINIARGELRFVGVPPRSASAIRDLPEDWRALYLRSKAGLITEASLLSPGSDHPEDYHVSDAYYAIAGGILHDFRLVVAYLGHALFGRGSGKTESRREQVRISHEDSVRAIPQ